MNFMNNDDMRRRTFLRRSGFGLGSVALGYLMMKDGQAGVYGDHAGIIQPTHLPMKVKRVIHLCMAGGPSHLETLDEKPELARQHGKSMPESLTQGQPIAQLQGQKLTCLGPQHEFSSCGDSGLRISNALPHIQKIADDICVVRSMTTQQINHDPAHTFMNTGTQISGRPSMGSWVLYGLGADTQSLPGFVVLSSEGGGQAQPIASRQWHSGFLPSRYQGVHFHSKGDPVLYLSRPGGVSLDAQRNLVNVVQGLNLHRNEMLVDPEISTRIAQYEMAFRMQLSVPELMNFENEPAHILDMYGAKPGDGSFASNCVLARRLAERGVRFIQLYHRGWDHHGGVRDGVLTTAGYVDRASAALVQDLKQRGLLDETLVVWGGEFGRTPMSQGGGDNPGRDHHIKGFSFWLAGGGIKPGFAYGNTDDFGYNAVESVVSVHDFHATMLHMLGIDHRYFTYRFQGLDMRLTGVEDASVLTNILT